MLNGEKKMLPASVSLAFAKKSNANLLFASAMPKSPGVTEGWNEALGIGLVTKAGEGVGVPDGPPGGCAVHPSRRNTLTSINAIAPNFISPHLNFLVDLPILTNSEC